MSGDGAVAGYLVSWLLGSFLPLLQLHGFLTAAFQGLSRSGWLGNGKEGGREKGGLASISSSHLIPRSFFPSCLGWG